MNASSLPVPTPPRQSAWSGSKENIGHYKDNGDDTASAGQKDRHNLEAGGKCAESVLSGDHTIRQVHPVHRRGPVAVQQTAIEPYVEQSGKPAARTKAKLASEPAVKTAHNTHSQAHRAHADVVSCAQPAQRTKAGFEANASFPPSYVGMPASTAGITIGRPEAKK